MLFNAKILAYELVYVHGTMLAIVLTSVTIHDVDTFALDQKNALSLQEVT